MNSILLADTKVCNTPPAKRTKFDLLPLSSAKSTWLDLNLNRVHEAYTLAHIALHAIDHPHSLHFCKSEEEKESLWLARLAKFEAARNSYSALVDAEHGRRAKDKPVKPAQATLTARAKPEAQQIRLFADAWPESFSYIIDRLPRRPFVANDLEKGVTVRPLAQCSGWRYMQYNSPIADHLLVIDYDAPKGVDILDATKGLPAPAWISRTPGTNRGHIVWALAVPVLTTSAAKLKPLQYLARIEEGFRKHIDGDKGFAGLLTKSPLSDVWDINWIEPKPYTLDELADSVSIDRYTSKKKGVEIEPVGLGRKVLTFERARHWSYSAVSQYWVIGYDGWFDAVRGEIDAINSGFECPLPDAHCKSIARSIAKWVWARFTPLTKHQLVLATHTPAEQARRGALKGAKRRTELMPKAKEMAAAGATQREIAAELAVAQRTIADWLKV